MTLILWNSKWLVTWSTLFTNSPKLFFFSNLGFESMRNGECSVGANWIAHLCRMLSVWKCAILQWEKNNKLLLFLHSFTWLHFGTQKIFKTVLKSEIFLKMYSHGHSVNCPHIIHFPSAHDESEVCVCVWITTISISVLFVSMLYFFLKYKWKMHNM